MLGMVVAVRFGIGTTQQSACQWWLKGSKEGNMKKIILLLGLFTFIMTVSSTLWAEDMEKEAGWLAVFKSALERGKGIGLSEGRAGSDGLAYTPPEEVILEEAISQALSEDKAARACECLKTAVDLEYNPYLVLKIIYAVGGYLEIDQLCMCATEAGVMKAIIAKAARDAMSPLNQPIYEVDEIAQSQCLKGLDGLAYTLADEDLKPIPFDDKENNNIVSVATP